MFHEENCEGIESDTDLSLSSAVVSEAENEYPIKGLIADKFCDRRKEKVYLVHWEGYPIERATWEPKASFEGDKVLIIQEYEERKAAGMVPDFDWQAWDADREREAEAKEERQIKRAAKRKASLKMEKEMAMKSQSAKRDRRKGKSVSKSAESRSSELEAFIVPDNSEPEEEEFDQQLPSVEKDDDSDVPIGKWALRKRVKKQAPLLPISDNNGDSNSSDSLMEELSAKAERKGKGTKGKGRAARKTPPQRQSQRVVPKKRPLAKSPSGPPPARKRPSAGASLKAQRPPVAELTLTTGSKFFHNLSTRNAVNKKGKAERAPPADQLDLIKLGGGGPSSTVSAETEQQTQEADAMTRRSSYSAQQVQKRKRSPSVTRPPGPGPKLSGSGACPQPNKVPLNQPGMSAQDRLPPQKRHVSELDTSTVVKGGGASVQPDHYLYLQPPKAQGIFPLVVPASQPAPCIPSPEPAPFLPSGVSSSSAFQQAVLSQSTPDVTTVLLNDSNATNTASRRSGAYYCEVEYGPSLSTIKSMGSIGFTGFSNSLLLMLRALNLEKFWISKSLETSYIARYFVPTYGPPLEYAELDIPDDRDISSFTNTLSVFMGAGLVIHEQFTMLVFLASNDQLRILFKNPLQRSKAPLRAVMYPPLGIRVPKPDGGAMVWHKPLDQGFEHYLPNLMSLTLGSYGDILNYKVPPGKRSYSVTYCPDVAKAECIELESVLRLNGHRIFKIHDANEVWKVSQNMKLQVSVFVHQSLQYQLHLLPNIKLLRRLGHVIFRFFGAKVEPGLNSAQQDLLNIIDFRFWSFGTVIMLTPKFIVGNEVALLVILKYQTGKSGSTKLCMPPKTFDRLEKYLQDNSKTNTDKVNANRILALVYLLKDRMDSGDAIELPIDGPIAIASDLGPGGIGEKSEIIVGTGSEIDILIDRFAFFHLEECGNWRRFVLCHSAKENVQEAKELFPTIEFLNPDSVLKEFDTKPSRHQSSVATPRHL